MQNLFFIQLSKYTAKNLHEVVDDLARDMVENVKELADVLPIALPPGKVVVLRIDIADQEELEKPWL